MTTNSIKNNPRSTRESSLNSKIKKKRKKLLYGRKNKRSLESRIKIMKNYKNH